MAKLYTLTPLQVSKSNKLGWLADGGGLYLRTRKSGSKSWVFRYERNKKKKDFALWPLNTIGLAKARQMAGDCRLALVEGRTSNFYFQTKMCQNIFRCGTNFN